MLEIQIPGWAALRLEYLVLDLNGTLALDGELLPGVKERLARLADLVGVTLLTGDLHGTAEGIAAGLEVSLERVAPEYEARQKRDFVNRMGKERVVAMGNGVNDAGMLEAAALGICVLGPEGAAVAALRAADVVVNDPLAGLDLLLASARLIATLRG